MVRALNLFGYVIATVLVACTLFSCGSDEKNAETETQVNIDEAVGTWMCTSSSDTYQGNTHTGLLVGAQVTIKNDGTYTSTSNSIGAKGSYTMNGDTFTVKNSSGDTFVVKVSVNGNTMTWQGTSSTGVSFNYVFAKE